MKKNTILINSVFFSVAKKIFVRVVVHKHYIIYLEV
jgi:hypothetical protein